jgi:hypothetical protein
MQTILLEIEAALNAGFYYLAIAIALSLPDVCSALESPDGTTSGTQYKAWYDVWLAPTYPMITAVDLYSLRCGIVHQGRFGHNKMQYSRILFTVPNPQGNVFHRNIINDALNLDACMFCRDILRSVSSWYAAKRNEPTVQANLPRLLRFYPQGLAPYMVGMPLIA